MKKGLGKIKSLINGITSKQKITIISNELIRIENHGDFHYVSEKKIIFGDVTVVGEDLKINVLNKYDLMIKGIVHEVALSCTK